ncbi:hypothetical protein CA267_012270 [Alteromonas pelagimontana]|uniref:Solute-binding protein family 3/N-terminal domain-containing protein n=1 Tax=Alteromonas pelagimontana TaxID=1858656 RepID=A0A6M4MFQ9_9ALTE|nr:hypothetical protein [Alteromonas pelagimontana]QJR81500.1 hypothetical protein CA267_012270 [Alteromonas pelagimontana]
MKVVVSRTVLTLFTCLSVAFPAIAELTFGAAPFPTYIDDEGEPARLNAIVMEAFKRADIDVTLQVLRPAFLGSGLRSGRLDGEYGFIGLDDKKDDRLYSTGYLPVNLYVAGKRRHVLDIQLLPHLQNERVAIENRFANSSALRLIKDVKWARNPSTFDAFRQLADDRAPYLMTTGLLIDEFNRLLRADDEELLFLSPTPLFKSHFYLSLSKTTAEADAKVNAFNTAIAGMQKDGSFNKLLGLSWLSKDIDQDGVGDFISSASVAHARIAPELLKLAFALDDVPTGEKSAFYIDDNRYSTWEEAAKALANAPIALRPSFLDEEVYSQIIRRW